MNVKTQKRIELTLSGIMVTISLVCLLSLLMLATGCSTVNGVGQLLGGMGNDISDMAEGTRQRMKERN